MTDEQAARLRQAGRDLADLAPPVTDKQRAAVAAAVRLSREDRRAA